MASADESVQDAQLRSSRYISAPARKIRVAHLLHTMAYGGPETIILNWVRALDPERFESYLVCFRNPGDTQCPFVDAAQAAGLTVRYIPWARRKPLLRSARAMARIARELDIDIIHCYNTYADLVGVLVKWLTGKRIITTLWVWGALGWKRRILQWADRIALPFFDRVTAQSEDARRDTAGPGMRLENVYVLVSGYHADPMDLTPEDRARGRAELGAAPNDFLLIHVARFWPEKAHEVLLEAFQTIHSERPDTRLWLAGVGPELERIRTMTSAIGLDGPVRFLGFRTDLPYILALADLQVHPSHAEGIPLALCSGMAAGMPIVATAVGGIPEIVRSGYSGLLVPPGDPDAVAAAVLRLMHDDSERRRLCANARKFIETEYSLEAAAARLGAMYQEMVEL
jgi:glycosyltransferase involved in cell wall biosynthesis